MNKLQVKIKVSDDRLTPSYANTSDAGLDLRANIELPMRLQRGSRVTVPTGVFLEIPPGYFGAVCQRSGLAKKHGLTVANAPGIVDAAYRGEVCVILQMHGDDAFTTNPFDRIAQLVIQPCMRAELIITDELTETARGTGGFGSSGRG
ncbi:dUTP diphosphatase [Propionivibrio sp.]|uniref:dUTP diphosphatase n=1 Tax=Propionivibrio sp. TaxID=2212460 RepID=UPI003BEF98B1